MELKFTKNILVKNVDVVLLKKIDRYANSKKMSRSKMIRNILEIQFKYTEGSIYEDQLTFEQVIRFANIQTKRNQILLEKLLEIKNEK